MGQAKSSLSSATNQAGSPVTPSAPDQTKPAAASDVSDQREYTSSLSSPPASGQTISTVSPPASEPSPSTLSPSSGGDPSPPANRQSPSLVSPPQNENAPFQPISSNTSSDRVIQNSDDEGEDSDSSLEDLSALLAAKSSEVRAKQAMNGNTPSTPVASRHQTSSVNFHVSPLPLLSKYKFDLKSLVSRAEDHEAIEASSKRVKAMMASKDDDEDTEMSDHAAELAKFPHGALLGSVVAGRDDLEAHKVSRAIMRTEAAVTEKYWYFFDTHSKPPKQPERTPFPIRAVPDNWKKELVDPKTRYHTFVSGFAENMVTFGKKLPDELFLWVLDEACLEGNDPLRSSYQDIIKESTEQVRRLIDPVLVRKIFLTLGGSSIGTDITQKVVPVSRLGDPYPRRDWARLLSIIKLFGAVSKSLQQNARTVITCMLLRMSVDHVVYENVDLLDSLQVTLRSLCKYTPGDDWGTCCQEVCKALFECIDPPTLRLKIVDSISSITPRTHDLRRRLAMCFYFDDLSYARDHSHSMINLDAFIKRLDDPEFETNAQTDYRELTALILLLDIAVDDGRSINLDLSDPAVEKEFDEAIEDFGATIKDIMRTIGNPGAAFISRIEAKEVLELVSQRVSDTLRSRPKPKQTWFDKAQGKPQEDLESERRGMQSFISRVKEIGSGSNGQAAK
ncbi:hypothetical protein N431DRAFT_539854 [Stipitochalara longipes BDJ]|nr:hypothetical protein N431DRAFT_539854 [Stipitochalara longipes BDJ]